MALWLAVVFSLFSPFVTIFLKDLAYLFGTDQFVTNIVAQYFLIISIGYVCNAVTNCVLGTVNGFVKPTVAMLIMIFYYVIVRIPLAKVLSMTALGLHGIWIAVLFSHVAASLASIIYYRICINKKTIKVKLEAV